MHIRTCYLHRRCAVVWCNLNEPDDGRFRSKHVVKYEGESNENRKTEIKIRNIAPLSYKLADMLPML
jgi:hypothetical protein